MMVLMGYLLSFLYYYFKMGKNTKKSGAGRKPKQTFVPLSYCSLQEKIKTKFISKAKQTPRPEMHPHQISKLLNEEILSCSICLQLLLSPVLAQCGHSFCLYCSEDLAKNGFACGICHTHLPSYDLQHSHIIDNLINEYLDNQESEERQNYDKRRQEMRRKQENRRLKEVQEGNIVDFWCQEELAWKSATVTEKMKNGTLTITQTRNNKETSIDINSRRLAPHRTFTKDQAIPDAPHLQFRPVNLASNPQYQPIRMRMPQRPYIFGMPLLLGYYWRDGNFRGDGDVVEEDQQFPF